VSFSPDWLAQRRPYDHQARSDRLTRAFASCLPPAARVVDLAGGAGSGAAYLRERAPHAQITVLDHDPALLALAASAGFPVQRSDLRALDLPDADAWHCQALLDLVSWSWLDASVARLTARPRPLLAALSVDGRVCFDPVDPDDDSVLAAFRAHQRLDRGFGPSPGTQAAAALGAGLARAGWDVRVEPADWAIPASDAAMVRVMVDGIAEAAAHTHADPAAVERWRARRGGGLVVGHVDLFAIP